MDLRGRVALVTGGGHRVGKAIALALGERGMSVAVHYNATADGAAQTVRELEQLGVRAESFGGDLTDVATPPRLIAQVVQAFDGLDVLVNSAAIMRRTPFGETGIEDWDEILALNLRAPFFMSQAAAPHLRERRGSIVNIADLAAFETWPGYLPHGISKAGIVHMTRGLARVLAPEIRVNAIAPGTVLLPDTWTDKEREHLDRTTPLGRQGSPADVTQALLYLLDAEYVTGETIIVDGGRHVRT